MGQADGRSVVVGWLESALVRMGKRVSYGRVRAGEFPNIPALRRGVRMFLTWTVVGVTMMAIYLVVILLVVKRPIWGTGAAGISCVFQTVGTVLWVRWNRRVSRDVQVHRGRVCLHCLYPLVQLSNRGNCPECGKPYDIAEVQAEWGAFQQAHGRAVEHEGART